MPASGYKNRPIIAEMFTQTYDLVANRRGFVGPKLMPVKQVQSQAGEYYKITAAHLKKKRPEMRVNDEGNFPEVSYKWTYSSYSTVDRGIEFRLTDRLKGIHGNDIALEAIGAEILTDMMAEDYEQEVIDLVNAETPTAASAAWTTASTDIIGDVEAARTRLFDKQLPIDKESLTLVVPRLVWIGMKKNTGILDTFGSSERTDAMSASLARIADILEVKEIVVSNSIKQTTPDGGTASFSSMWTATKAALVVTGRGGDGPTDVRWGNCLEWSEAGGAPPRFDRYVKENKTAEVMRQRSDRCLHRVMDTAIEVISGVAS